MLTPPELPRAVGYEARKMRPTDAVEHSSDTAATTNVSLLNRRALHPRAEMACRRCRVGSGVACLRLLHPQSLLRFETYSPGRTLASLGIVQAQVQLH
jgi:hypothetical protein